MSNATPGPWVRHDTADYAEIHPASGKQKSAIALVGRAEDADLIADAPELREALIETVSTLRAVHSALGVALGDTDITHIEDDDELRSAAPVQWAATRIAHLLSKLETTS